MDRVARWIGVAILVVLTWRFARTPLDESAIASFLHLPNLIFHEAGHVLFSPFGRFISVLAGSLFQIAVPLICAGAFLWQHGNRFGAAVCTWWGGQNLVDVSPYIADARALRLTLIGGRTGAEVEGHDWEYLLTAMGWLHLDTAIGRAAHVLGVLVMIGAIGWAITLLIRGQDDTSTPQFT
jgi:hypothetical protein